MYGDLDDGAAEKQARIDTSYSHTHCPTIGIVICETGKRIRCTRRDDVVCAVGDQGLETTLEQVRLDGCPGLRQFDNLEDR